MVVYSKQPVPCTDDVDLAIELSELRVVVADVVVVVADVVVACVVGNAGTDAGHTQ